MSRTEPLPPFFDARAAWTALSPEQQTEVGRIALVLGCALAGEGSILNSVALARTSWIASDEALELLDRVYQEIVQGKVLAPDLNKIGVRACTGCGCTDRNGCADGCDWVGPTLCSACVPEGRP